MEGRPGISNPASVTAATEAIEASAGVAFISGQLISVSGGLTMN